MFCFIRPLIFLFVAIAIVSAPSAVDAQEKKAKKAGFDVEKFLKRLDVNQNGKVEPSEIKDDRTRGFLKNAGVDTSKPISIKKFARKINKKRDLRNSPGASQQTLGFSVSDDERDEESGDSPGFAVSEDEREPIAKARQRQFSDGAKKMLDWVLKNYDKNKDGKIDAKEIREARWTDPPVSESDTNKDGSLSRMELLIRYQKREDKKSKSKSRSKDRDREDRQSRWGDRKRDRERYSSKRSESKSKSKATSANKAGNRDVRKGYETYVSGLFKTYDKNKDGSLDQEEVEGMRRKPDKKADANGDEKITKEELINSYLEKAGQGKSKSSNSRDSKSRLLRGSSPASSSNGFGNGKGRPQLTSKDANKNGKIEMAEFAKVWTVEKFEEFRKIDTNDDRVITKSEWDNK